MATGVPCVVTEVGDSPAIVGDTGWTCPPDDVAGLRSVLERAVNGPDERRSRGALARQRVVDSYDTQRLIDRTAARLAAVADRAGRRH
jgi:glycosyltransferase involved in cell wall biosynthesis